jgi:hypothetical protein
MLIYCSYELVTVNRTEYVLHSQKVVFPYIALNVHHIPVLQMKVIGLNEICIFVLCTVLFV